MDSSSKNMNFTLNTRNNFMNTTGESQCQWPDDESVLKVMMNESRLRTDEKYCGFDNNFGDSWIYPTNLPIRNYQFNITRAALFKNTLVVLPTGLGKTFIAAVVMYNIYRWYPTGKVIFMAPTRPLVNQQIEACRKIMGMPLSDIAEMTGKQNKKARHELWHSKRIFFATPQVVQSDINDNEQEFPFNDIKLLVIDEAHKAKGRYAYTEVVQSMIARNPYFRILALSATPGRRIEDVAEIVRNLYISHIELRWENSVDVISYTHKKNVKTIVVLLGEELKKIKDEFIEIIDPYIRNLIDNGVLSGSVQNISRGWLIMEQKRYREMSIHHKHPNHATVSTDLSICISLYHALELLERHGIRVFLNFFDDNSSDNSKNTSGNGKSEKFFVAMNPRLKKFLDDLRQKAGPNPFLISDQTMTNGQIARIPEDLDFGHPKFEMTKKFLMEHFEKEKDSRAIIFCEYRESVLLIHRLLLQCRPLIRPRVFVGQGGAGSIRAVTQKQQIQIMSDFRNGISNTLIATSVAEEGIDVGDVDLIICFDISTKNPTRFVQRIGRTGRKRQGNVILLVTEGREHSMVKEVLATKDKTNQKIAKSKEIQQILCKTSPRLVPPEFDPKCVQTFIRIPNEETENNEIKQNNAKKGKKKPVDIRINDSIENIGPSPKKAKGRSSKKLFQSNKNSDVRKFFKKMELDNEEKEIFNVSNKKEQNENTFVKNIDINDNNNLILIEENRIETTNYVNDSNKKKQYQSSIKKLNNFSRRLDKPPSDCELIKSPIDALKSKNLSKLAKRFYLEQNSKYLKEKFEAIKAVEAISDMNENEITNDIMNLKEEFVLIENVFGGRHEIIRFLENCNSNVDDNDQLIEMETKFSWLFDGLKKRDIFDNIEDFMDEKLKEIESDEENEYNDIEQQIVDDKRNFESIVYDNSSFKFSQHPTLVDNNESCVNDFDYTDSKYCSQWTQFKKDAIKMQSTPLRNENKKKNFSLKSYMTTTTTTNIGDEKNSNGHDNFDKVDNDNNELLDDDFNEILATSSNALFDIESHTQNNNEEKYNENNDMTLNSMVHIDKIWNMISKNENMITENQSSKESEKDFNNEIEDFDLNDFFEPFNEEEDEIFLNEQILNENDSKIKCENNSNDKKNLFDKPVNMSSQINQQELISLNNINSNKNVKNYDNNHEMKCENFSKTSQIIQNTKESITNSSISPKNLIDMKSITNTSPSVFKRKTNLSRLNQFHSETDFTSNINKSNTSDNEDKEINDESVIRMLNKNKRKIESSESSGESENEILESSQKNSERRFKNLKRIKEKKRRRCSFFNDEAECSGNDSHNEDYGDQSHSRYVLNSIVVDDFEEPPLTINMRAKYLQSIRSPKNNLGAFKIPVARVFPSLSQICSQPIAEEDHHLNTYKEDSFVVSDEENIPEREINETCPLERAEAILKAKRKAKKLNSLQNKRKRIISKFNDSSDEER